MPPVLFLADRASVADAARLLADHGEAAVLAAAAEAERSRSLGNHIHFCRWRQIERLIAVMASDAAVGTLH